MISSTSSRSWPRWIPLGLLLGVTVVAFAPSLNGGFVFDDHQFVRDNLAIRDLSSPFRFFTDVSTLSAAQGGGGQGDIYRPLRTLTFAVDWALFGDRALGYRVVNLLWHLTAVVLAWFLLMRILADARLATVGTALFALHPLQTQAVAWITCRGGLMAAVFLLAALLLLLRDGAGVGSAVSGALLYALALLSKESAIALLAIVPFADLLLSRPRPRMRWGLYAALGVVTVLFLMLRFERAGLQVPFEWSRLLDAGSGLVILTGSTLAPMGLTPNTGSLLEGRYTVWTGGVVLAVAGAAVVLALVRGRRAPRAAFALLFAAACLAPVSGLVPLKGLAESRFAYLPLLGGGLGLALIVSRLGTRGLALGAATVVLLAVLTFRESRVWTSDYALWETAVARESRIQEDASAGALGNLAVAVAGRGDHERAVLLLRRSTARLPIPGFWANLATECTLTGRPEEALRAGQIAVEMDPRLPRARDSLGTVFLVMRRFPEAEAQLRIAAELDPEDGLVRRRWGRALFMCGRATEALDVLREAVRQLPLDPGAHALLGKALHVAREFEGARDAFLEAARLDPSSPDPLASLGELNLDFEHPDAAVRWFERALELDARDAALRAEWIAALAARDSYLVPSHVKQLLDVIEELWRAGEHAPIVSTLGRNAIRRLPGREFRLLLVRSLLASGDAERARQELEDFARQRPEDVTVQARLGLLELRLNRPREAIAPLEQATSLAPNSHQLRMALAHAYRGAGREADALRMARQAAEQARTPEEAKEASRFLE
jgi:protein O-mannosyl-transferase